MPEHRPEQLPLGRGQGGDALGLNSSLRFGKSRDKEVRASHAHPRTARQHWATSWLSPILNASAKSYRLPPQQAPDRPRDRRKIQSLICCLLCWKLLAAAEAVREGHSHCHKRANSGEQILPFFTQVSVEKTPVEKT